MIKKSHLTLPTTLLLAFLLAACQSSNQQQPETATPDNSSKEAAGATAGGKRSSQKPRESREAAAEQRLTAPAGTVISVRLGDTLDSGKVETGATFQGTLAEALVVQGVEVAPVGSNVTGQIVNAVSSGRLNRPAELALTLTSLTAPGSGEVQISTDTWGSKAGSHKKRNIEMIGGGAAAGALIGALTGGKKGAAIGAGVGAGGGTGVAAATGKKEIVLAAETKLEFKLAQPVTFIVRRR